MEAKIDEILAFADIGDFVHQPVKMYSSGMFARLAFAVAINVEPDILIVDEALSVGDFAFQAKCNLYMKEYLSNKTILFVTHDMATVSKMAKCAILIDGGKLIEKAEVKETIQMYTKLLQDKVSYKYKESIDSTYSNEWKNILDSNISGKKEILIKAFNITEQALFMANDIINCKFLIESNKKLENIIFGYFLNDRHGVQVFGETTLSDNQTYNLEEGKYIIELSFIWPEIKEGSYFLNFGIGMGSNPLVHEIQCWAQNIHEIKNTDNGTSIHGIFNNKMQSFTINKGA
jgi:teichoic acid transport system ATP-binding protein